MSAVTLTNQITDKHSSAQVLGTFEVAYRNGWDCDTTIALVRKGGKDGKVVLMGTDHGKLVTITKVPAFFAQIEAVYSSRLKPVEPSMVLHQLS